MSRTDILILDGESLFTPKVVRSLGLARRWRSHVLARVRGDQKPALAWSRHVRSFHLAPADGDDRSYLAAIGEAVRRTRSRLVLPVTEPTILFCIRHREELEKVARLGPLPDAGNFVRAVDKGHLAAFMARHGIPHPRTWLPGAAGPGDVSYPVLVKPRRACGGEGFTKIDSAGRLQRELARRPDRADVCIQEFVAGVDLGCSVLVRHGRVEAWTTQRGLRQPRPYAPCSELQMEACEPVLKVTERLMGALNWSGVANVDFRMDVRTGRVFVLEVNGRYWASLWASTAARVNFPHLACQMGLGEALSVGRPRAGRYVHPRLFCRDLLRLRRSVFRRQWTGLSLILRDPLPEMIRCLNSFGLVPTHAESRRHPTPITASVPAAVV